MIAQDKEIVKVILLLTGSIHGTKNLVSVYIKTFKKYKWLWKDNIEARLATFSKKDPTIDDFEEQLNFFSKVEDEINSIDPIY
jgi:dynein heavy chain